MNQPDVSPSPATAAPAARLAATALAAACLTVVCAASVAQADERCSRDLQNNVCLEANPDCPPVAGPLGPAAGSWPVFQHDLQHTGKSPFSGPTCANVLWTRKLQGKLQSAPTLAPGGPGEPESLFVAVGKQPVCALDPEDGSVEWCGTTNKGKLVDRSAPALGNGHMLYVGTRDNDLWAIDLPPAPGIKPDVSWRQKICTDGDVTTPPVIGSDGTIYMGSDSLGAGTLMAMCPGQQRQPRWCINPIGGGIRNASPALSPSGDRLYVTIGGRALGAFDPASGEELWRVELERPGSVGRAPNYAPVVHPTTGVVYLGTKSGLWEIEAQTDPQTGKESGTARLLFDTGRARVYSPPAVDAARGRLVFGASQGNDSTLYVIGLDGALEWKRSGLSARLRNNSPVIDAEGRIYLAFTKSVVAFSATGDTLWSLSGRARYNSSPILADGKLYVGTVNGLVMAIGGCAS